MKIETISQTLFDERSKFAIDAQPMRKTIPLGHLKVVNSGAVEIDGSVIAMNEKAFSQLARILGVPIQFQGRVDKYFGEDATSALVNKMKSALIKQGVSTITVVASPATKQIIGFLKKGTEYISNGSFFELTSDVINDHNLLVRDFSVNSANGGIVINCFNPNAVFGLEGLNNEDFQGGITFSNSLEGGLSVSPYINRLICTNGMIGESFDEAYKVKSLHSRNLEEFRHHLKSLERQNYQPHSFEQRVNKAIVTKASYGELEKAAHLIMSSSGAKGDEITKWIPFQETRRKFVDFGVFPDMLGVEQKKNAKTGTSIWDVINGITHFATHTSAFNVDENSRRYMQKVAGEMLVKGYNMENQVITPFK